MLQSPRLVYSQMDSSDETESIKMSQNEKVMVYITGKSLNREEAKERFSQQLSINQNNPKIGFIKAQLKSNRDFIGYIKMVQMSPGVLEVGYAIVPQHWGKGYASEMLKAMIAYAPSLKTFDTLLGVVNMNNPASVKILTNHGFTLQEIFQKSNHREAHFIKKID